MAADNNEGRTKSKKRILLVILLCILMIVAGLVAGVMISNYFNQIPDRQYDNNAENIRQDESGSETEEIIDSIAIPCWDTLIMIADQTEQEVKFLNPEKNKNCDFQLTLLLDDGTELWKSQLIPNGKAVYHITLNQPLQAGTYRATMVYDCYTTDGTKLNGSTLDFNLIAKEGSENE